MALIYADDYQQWATAASDQIKSPGIYPQYLGQNVPFYLAEMQGLGIYQPSYAQGYGGANSILYSLLYDTTRGALMACHPRSPADGSAALASGLRRKFEYDGDTLYFGTTIEFGGITDLFNGDFLFFGSNPDSVVFTGADQVGAYLYGVGIDANGFFSFNGVSTTVQAYYKPATVLTYIDVVFTPTTMELWINNVLAATQARTNIKLKEFGITAGKLVKITGSNFCIWIHSVIIADSTPGFGQRIGRKRAKTEQVQTTPTIESSLIPASGYIPLSIIRKFASGPTNETDIYMIGSLVSPLPYVRNDFGGTRVAAKKPYASAMNIQVKRLFPSADGMAVHPYVTIAGTKVYGDKVLPSSTWKMFHVPLPIAADQNFNAFNFGYEHDYKDLNKVYAVDRQNTEVYGSEIAADPQWWNATDLIAFDSNRIGGVGNFTDFTGKTIVSASGTLPTANNYPFKANESFKYGTGIDLNVNGALFTPLTGATLAQPHTIDFWFKESVDNAISALLGIYTNTTNTASFLELHTHDTQTTKMSLWNNNATARVISAWDTFKSSTTWRHLAFTYDGTTVSIYVNGTLLGTITWTILSFAPTFGLAHRAYWRQDTASRLIIERYRVRSGVAFTGNFNPETIYN